jgi:hypothetical protein
METFWQFGGLHIEGEVAACGVHRPYYSDGEAESTADLVNILCNPSATGFGTATGKPPPPRG